MGIGFRALFKGLLKSLKEVDSHATGLPATGKGNTSSLNKVDALPPEETQLAQTLALLRTIKTGNATASEIEEFRRLASEVLRNLDPRCSLWFKKRIEFALSLVQRS